MNHTSYVHWLCTHVLICRYRLDVLHSKYVAAWHNCFITGRGCCLMIWIDHWLIVLQGYTRRALRSEIRKPCRSKRMRGIGNSFQPAIVASRFDLMNCDIAPSAKMMLACDIAIKYFSCHDSLLASMGQSRFCGHRVLTAHLYVGRLFHFRTRFLNFAWWFELIIVWLYCKHTPEGPCNFKKSINRKPCRSKRMRDWK